MIQQNGLYAVATGTANAHVAAFSPPITTRTDGMVLRYKAPAANTGALTFNDGLGAVAVVGAAHAALQGGETAVNGDVWVQWNSSIGGGSYVLIDSTGGAVQVAPATQSQHAPQMGQVAGVVGTARNVQMNLAAAATSATWTADEVVVKSAIGGLSTLVSAINLTFNGATVGAGGMDVGTLPTSGFVGVYLIWGAVVGVKLYGTNASSTSTKIAEVYGGATGLPSGYTHSALLSIVPTNSSAQMLASYQIDRFVEFSTITATSGTTSGVAAAVSLVSVIPYNAKAFTGGMSLTCSNSGTMNLTVSSRSTSSAGTTVGNSNNAAAFGVSGSVPLLIVTTPQQCYLATSGSAPLSSWNLGVCGYTF
jgi:hypothetical protein